MKNLIVYLLLSSTVPSGFHNIQKGCLVSYNVVAQKALGKNDSIYVVRSFKNPLNTMFNPFAEIDTGVYVDTSLLIHKCRFR